MFRAIICSPQSPFQSSPVEDVSQEAHVSPRLPPAAVRQMVHVIRRVKENPEQAVLAEFREVVEPPSDDSEEDDLPLLPKFSLVESPQRGRNRPPSVSSESSSYDSPDEGGEGLDIELHACQIRLPATKRRVEEEEGPDPQKRLRSKEAPFVLDQPFDAFQAGGQPMPAAEGHIDEERPEAFWPVDGGRRQASKRKGTVEVPPVTPSRKCHAGERKMADEYDTPPPLLEDEKRGRRRHALRQEVGKELHLKFLRKIEQVVPLPILD
jgi:hypothetical protein